MSCARIGCRRRADVVVDCGAGLLVLWCGRCAVVALGADSRWRIVRVLADAEPVTIRPRGA